MTAYAYIIYINAIITLQEQLIFLHDAILESVTCGNTQISASDLRAVIRKYGKVDPSTGVTHFQSQFNVSVILQVVVKPTLLLPILTLSKTKPILICVLKHSGPRQKYHVYYLIIIFQCGTIYFQLHMSTLLTHHVSQ